ncbi:GCN5-related N-acetyltransferase [Desulfofarcimen acetoxidans DSM 771]|uniref:GCN5-related N-acetyltransferase n=1 Tax=Desulfofarcimen acetoxidans (strain ATCC 49208 / DSM 771 / KCTC 5769 / VKM B-1644 / 5575) TaxID=485916 RepID=C8W2G0_DESAS|nr:GNAT family N-acetyltransferase [Desulfofarcimen acetoxidans]ACV63644.1 GCN5-related N-acetyltransferase [Desulfofarcimen acetoxidans DSM 771]
MEFGIVIRKARAKDIEAMVGLLELLFKIETDFDFDWDKQRRGLEMMLDEENHRCLIVAELHQEIIGMCSAQLLVSTAEGGLKSIIEDVVIAKSFRGQGVAKRLLLKLEEWALNQGVKRLDLVADRHNGTALRFYKNMNWQSTDLICLQKKLL